ncbi:MAG TPA: thiamine phosphate synthase [Candidatus Polarisedimenticolia bacterium]|nr:thiamine phosphate synthase [Candidatus Polarisedimenticolia bacterium]
MVSSARGYLDGRGPLFPPLYAIVDPSTVQVPAIELAGQLARAGVRLVQLRDKRSPARTIYGEVKELAALLAPHGVRLILNDRPDIAAIAGAGGVHVGQDDLPVEHARRICKRPFWVGVSTHNLDQLREAARTSADYIAVGPIFPTATKENPDPVVGAEFLRAARELTQKPLVAIGGITVDSAAEVFRAGADSVAVIRDLVAAGDPVGRAREYLAIAERVRSERG